MWFCPFCATTASLRRAFGAPPTISRQNLGLDTLDAIFVDRLDSLLQITSNSGTVEVPGAGILSISVDCKIYGFVAALEFVIASEQKSDDLFRPFLNREPLRILLVLKSGREAGDGETAFEKITLSGVVTERSVRERMSEGLAGNPVIRRRYRIRFVDPAAALWKDHFPLELHTEKSYRKVMESHAPKGIKIEYDWSFLKKEPPFICVAPGGAEGRSASYYDWIADLLERQNGLLEYDATGRSYRFGSDKSKDPKPASLEREHVLSVEHRFAEPIRHAVQVLNASAELQPKPTKLKNDDATEGVKREILERSPVTTPIDSRAGIEQTRLKEPGEELMLQLGRFPYRSFIPGRFVSLRDGWGDRVHEGGRTYRVTRFSLEAEAADGEAAEDGDLALPIAEYRLQVRIEAEEPSSPTPRRPPGNPISKSIQVEAKIQSASGGDKDRTWFVVEDKKTSRLFYNVHIPLWNAKIQVPFGPETLPGHMFFPSYKFARVLLDIGQTDARLVSFLDWAEGARSPQDSQANRMVLGKQSIDGTVMEHFYQDQKPTFRIQRRQGQDLQTIEMTDGRFFLEVKEDPTAKKVVPTHDVRIQTEAAKGQLRMKATSGVTEMNAKLEGAVGQAKNAIENATQEMSGQIDDMDAKLGGKLDECKSRAENAANELAASVGDAGASVDAAKGEILSAVAGSGAARMSGQLERSYQRVETKLARREKSVGADAVHMQVETLLRNARSHSETTESQIRTIAMEAVKGLDLLREECLARLKELIAQANALISAATETFDALKAGLGELRPTLLDPIAAVSEQIVEIQNLFEEASSSLRSLLAQGVSALDAIPASALPQAMVAPTVSTIQGALSAALPPLEKAMSTFGTQVGTASTKVSQQVEKVQSQMAGQLENFIQTAMQQADGVLHPLLTEIERFQGQVVQSIAQLTEQADQAQKLAMDNMLRVKGTGESQIQGWLSQAESKLE